MPGIVTFGARLKKRQHHIIYLEIPAVYYSLEAFQHLVVGLQIFAQNLRDNTTAVACLNYMGTSHSENSNVHTKIFWEWCIENHVWISSAHI